jgi:hypothetical protein
MKNFQFTAKLEYNLRHVKLWAGMTAFHMIGPDLFNGPDNTASQAYMLEVWLKLPLRDSLKCNSAHTDPPGAQ